MASVKKQDIPQIGAFMSDFWILIKQYWIPENTAEYWDSLVDDCTNLMKKYQNERFVVDILAAFVDNREAKMRNGG